MCAVRLQVGSSSLCFFFQAEDGIRDHCVTGVQTCALPILSPQPTVEEMEHRFLKVHQMDKPRVAAAIARNQQRTLVRSEERRVGKECRSRWTTQHEQKKHNRDLLDQRTRAPRSIAQDKTYT